MAAPRSFARLLSSSSVIGMLVPLSSTAAAGEGSAPKVCRQHITQEDMEDLAAYISSMSGEGMPQGGGAARLFLVAVPLGGGSPIADPEQPGTASAARPPTEEEKRAFQFMKFDLQRKLSAASSRNGYLTLLQIIAEAESSVNEEKSRSVEEGQQELRKSTEVYERWVAEDRKVDEILSILLEVKRESSASGGSSFEKVDVKVDQILSIVQKNHKSSSTNGSSSEEADHTAGPVWNMANCSCDNVSCKIYHFVVRDGRRHLGTILGYLSKIDIHLTSRIKYYLLALPFAVWLSMGLSAGEMKDLLMIRHQKMSKECKQEVVEYRKVQADEKEAKEKGVTVEDLLEMRKVSAEEADRKKLAAAAADAAETLRKKTAAEYTDRKKLAAAAADAAETLRKKTAAEYTYRKKLAAAAADAAETLTKKTAAEYTDKKKEASEAPDIDRKEAAEAGGTVEAAAAETPSAGMKGLLGWLKWLKFW